MGIFGPPKIEKLKAKKNVEGLIKALKHKDSKIRENAVNALGEIRDVRAVDPLIQAMKDDDTQRHAVLALEKIGWMAIEPMIQAMKDEDTRRHAVLALEKIGGLAVNPLTEALENNNLDVRRSAAEVLGKIGDMRAVEPLIQAMKDDDGDTQRHAVLALEKIGRLAVKALKNNNRDVRENAAKALGKIGDERAVKPLIQSLKDEDSSVRWKAVASLGKIGDERAVKPLIQSLKDEDGFVRCEAADALVMIREPAVLPLIHTLKGKNSDIREEAIKALGKIGDERAVESIALFLGDKCEDARKEAARALTKFGDIRAAEGIISELFLSEQSRLTLFQVLFSDYRKVSYEEFSEQLWPRLMENLFGDYTSLILRASDKPTSTREITYKGRSGEDIGNVHYGFSEIDDAIHELCKIHTQIATNLLHKVSQRRDVEVMISWGCTGCDMGQLSFKPQREMAKKELERRGNPPYDSSAYLDKEAWKL